jgi:hypothetical protein
MATFDGNVAAWKDIATVQIINVINLAVNTFIRLNVTVH